MRGFRDTLGLFGFALIASGCCSCPDASEAKAPDPVMEPAAVAEEPAAAEAKEPEAEAPPQGIAVGEPNPSAPAEPAEKPKEAPPEPKFTPGMSVDEAIAAVPKGWEYIGLEPDALGAPLSDLKLYEPCKLTPSQHFQLRVAIWDGKPVGIDVKSTNKKLASCIHDQVAQVTWRNKVKAINTVDYSY
ncbi:MAG TPA: hypothetical protein VHO25_10250 [Polyangiaceae bacterium]|nr:hypothetical protein [Polyangiaceae bacterium]